jgi:Na+-driven multidrug efflux pump
MIVIYIPLAIVFDRFFGVAGIFAAYAIANIVTGVVSYLWARASVQGQCDAHGTASAIAEVG